MIKTKRNKNKVTLALKLETVRLLSREEQSLVAGGITGDCGGSSGCGTQVADRGDA